MTESTNILIVGNGFDLSHYLPTKYDHFMDVMEAIEKKQLGQSIKNLFLTPLNDLNDLIRKALDFKIATNPKSYEMNFENLFWTCRNTSYVEKVKNIYDTSQIIIPFETVITFQYNLENNIWYQYFKQHVIEIKTWIDFEIKINEALQILANFFTKLENKLNENGQFENEISFNTGGNQSQIFMTREACNVLNKLKILKSGYYLDLQDYDENNNLTDQITVEDEDGEFRFYIEEEYIKYQSGFSRINVSKILSNMQNQLEAFMQIFNQYLELIVSRLKPKNPLNIFSDNWNNPDKIYSFNYTNTYQRLYNQEIKIEYLHGKSGETHNIVLGVSDIHDEALKKIKAYGFTKYHQKLFKDTDYLFLDEYHNKIIETKKRIDDLKNQHLNSNFKTSLEKEWNEIPLLLQKSRQMLNLNLYIWGHSLDESDREYILDLFSLNDDMDRNVRVIVYYFNNSAKFDLLNNLLHILGKDKVEQWMKNKWLEFRPNPTINFGV